jgi:hypothetical protein
VALEALVDLVAVQVVLDSKAELVELVQAVTVVLGAIRELLGLTAVAVPDNTAGKGVIAV